MSFIGNIMGISKIKRMSPWLEIACFSTTLAISFQKFNAPSMKSNLEKAQPAEIDGEKICLQHVIQSFLEYSIGEPEIKQLPSSQAMNKAFKSL
jgi:hypothetical protein